MVVECTSVTIRYVSGPCTGTVCANLHFAESRDSLPERIVLGCVEGKLCIGPIFASALGYAGVVVQMDLRGWPAVFSRRMKLV